MNPMYAREDLEGVQHDLDKPRITVYKNTWRVHQNRVYWCNLKLAQRKGLQFYHTRSHAITLYNTPLVIYTAKSINPQGCLVSYLRQIRNMDVRTRLIPMRENPPTTKANSVSLTSRGHTSQSSRRKSAMEVQGNLSR